MEYGVDIVRHRASERQKETRGVIRFILPENVTGGVVLMALSNTGRRQGTASKKKKKGDKVL